LRWLLVRLWAVFLRIVPPYPKFPPGLYTVGDPTADSPVLVTGNFRLTVYRLLQALENRVDVWALIVDSSGINVWCAAGGGFLTADKVISALDACRVRDRIHHADLILPQLAAAGVDGWRIREQTGWEIHWGPIRAEDLPAYLENGGEKTEAMRTIRFPLPERLEMVSGTLGLYFILLMIPLALFWRHLVLPASIALIGLSYFYAIFLPWLPGKDGLLKSIPLALLAVGGVVAYSLLWDSVPVEDLFDRMLGIAALSVFVSSEFQGMSPLMRGEQANWIWEAILGVFFGLLYWLVPLILGWR
jgi:hypothetical protein